MKVNVRMDKSFVDDVAAHAKTVGRSTPKQVELWARLGRLVEQNPELTYDFIKEAALAKIEYDAGLVSFRKGGLTPIGGDVRD